MASDYIQAGIFRFERPVCVLSFNLLFPYVWEKIWLQKILCKYK